MAARLPLNPRSVALRPTLTSGLPLAPNDSGTSNIDRQPVNVDDNGRLCYAGNSPAPACCWASCPVWNVPLPSHHGQVTSCGAPFNAEMTLPSDTDAPHVSGWLSHAGDVIEVLNLAALTPGPGEIAPGIAPLQQQEARL